MMQITGHFVHIAFFIVLALSGVHPQQAQSPNEVEQIEMVEVASAENSNNFDDSLQSPPADDDDLLMPPGLGMPMPVELGEIDPVWYPEMENLEMFGDDITGMTGTVPVMPADPHMFVRSPKWVPFSKHAFPHWYPFWDAALKSQQAANSMYQQPVVFSGLMNRPWIAPGMEPQHPPDCAMARAQGLPCPLDYYVAPNPNETLDRQDDPLPGVIQYPAYIPSEPGSPPNAEDEEIPATVPIASVPEMPGVHAVIPPGSLVSEDGQSPDSNSGNEEDQRPPKADPTIMMAPPMSGMMTTSMSGEPVMMIPYNPYGGQIMGPPMMLSPAVQGSAQMMAGGMPPGGFTFDSNGMQMMPAQFYDEGPIRDGEIPGMAVPPQAGPLYGNLFGAKEDYYPVMQPMPVIAEPAEEGSLSPADEAYERTGSNVENINWMLQRPWHLDNDQLQLFLFEIARFFSDATRLESLGTDANGTAIYALVICYSKLACQERPVMKPKVRIVAGIHGDHAIPRSIATFLIQYLLTYREVNPRVQRLLEKTEIHIIPAVNMAGWTVAYNSFVRRNRYSNITEGRWNKNNVDLAYDYPGLANYRNPLDRGFWEGRQKETIALMRYSLEESFVLSGTLASGDTLGVVIPFFDTVKNSSQKRPKRYTSFLNRKKRSSDLEYSQVEKNQTGNANNAQQSQGTTTPTQQPPPVRSQRPERRVAQLLKRQEARTPDQDVFLELAKRYSYAHPFMHEVGYACPWRHPRIGQHGVVNGAEFNDFYKGTTSSSNDHAKRSHAADWHYKYAGTMDMWIYISCYSFGTYQTMEAIWEKNVNSLVSFLEGAQTGVKGMVWANDTGNPIHNAMIEVRNRRYRVRTNHRGEYWRLLNSGVYEVRASKKGFQTCNWHRIVVANLEGPTILHFHLTREKDYN